MMSTEEKPLHVQVAEALGWVKLHERQQLYYVKWLKGGQRQVGGTPWQWHGENPQGVSGGEYLVPRYDTNWAATGPLIERFEIQLLPLGNGAWAATKGIGTPRLIDGLTPLIATCNLILALHAVGKLPKL